MNEDKTYQDGYSDGLHAALTAPEEPSLSSGSACFLVKDSSLKKMNAPFYNWLSENGFSKWEKSHGHYDGVDWVYVNLDSRLYNPGMPGVALAAPIGNHAVTITEFMSVFSMFEKNKGKNPLEF